MEITNAADLQPRSGPERPGQGPLPDAIPGRRGLPFLGWGLAIIAVIQIVVFGIQANLLKRTIARLDTNAEQQLRAYISVTPDHVGVRQQPENIVVSFNIENHGQTVGSDLRCEYGIDMIDRLPSDAVMPAATDHLTANNALFPKEKRSVRLAFKRAATATELTGVETGSKRLYVWGTLFYRDAFGKPHTTGFSFSAGAAAFAAAQRSAVGDLTASQWEFGANHNAAT